MKPEDIYKGIRGVRGPNPLTIDDLIRGCHTFHDVMRQSRDYVALEQGPGSLRFLRERLLGLQLWIGPTAEHMHGDSLAVATTFIYAMYDLLHQFEHVLGHLVEDGKLDEALQFRDFMEAVSGIRINFSSMAEKIFENGIVSENHTEAEIARKFNDPKL